MKITEQTSVSNPYLLFVPSLLKPTFEEDGLNTVSDLLSLHPSDFESRKGWGKRKTELLIALQHLYRKLATCQSPIDELPITSFIGSELLPDATKPEMTTRSFINASADEFQLNGTKKSDFNSLKQLLVEYVGASGSTQNPESFYLQGFEYPEMDWRDVPLNVQNRVVGFLDRFQIVSLKQLDQLASTTQVTCPKTGKSLAALDQAQFGNKSLENLRNELETLGRQGLAEYRRGVICGLEQLPSPDIDWRNIPLRVSKRLSAFLDTFRITSLKDVYALAVRGQFRCPDSGNMLSALDQKNFGKKTLVDLQKELLSLSELGLDNYRYGKAGKPKTATALSELALQSLFKLQARVLRLRYKGLTFEEIGKKCARTRQWARESEKKSISLLTKFRVVAENILKPVDQALLAHSAVALNTCLDLAGTNHTWQFKMTAVIADRNYTVLDSGWVSRFSSRQIEALKILLRDSIRTGTFALDEERVSLRKIINSASDQQKWFVQEWVEHVGEREESFTKNQLVALLGFDWIRPHLRHQLVNAGLNGLFFDEIETFGLIKSAKELSEFIKPEAEILADGRFRRPGEVYSKSNEIVAIVQQSDTPISVPDMIKRGLETWAQSRLVNYLSDLYEIVMTDRGLYVHIDKLALTVQDVKKIADWGAELLAGEREPIDGQLLFDLYKDSDLKLPLENVYQLVSIIAKHSDVRRISNNLQLAHRDSLDASELCLAVTDPDLANQWHPEKNGTRTPETVRPASTKKYWWRCELGHEFQASPVYRTRMIRNCPGCQEKWTITKIRHFVHSLQKHLDAFTPAELYVIFQQSGLWQRGGRAKGFVKALTTGRFPKKELDKFVDGEKSLVDKFIDDSDFELDQSVIDDGEQISELPAQPKDDIETQEADTASLPQVRAKQALQALDNFNFITTSTDAEAVEFLIASAKAKIWGHAYQDEKEAVAEAGQYGESEYAKRVRTEFLREYQAACSLGIPNGYAFTIDGKIRQPNLMQRHVATQIRDQLRYGNWSGTGSGKTLSAVLATRVAGASLTIVCCPNAVVGDVSDGWAREIQRVYPDSEVATKTLNPCWLDSKKPRYLVLNYEQFQQPDSEALLKRFVESNKVDFVVIDEVHFAKQRFANQMSQRKRLIQALVSVVGEANPNLRVLGMSATPVINNLQEGRSLVEMITGVEHDDINVKPTVPNCMRLHQKLATLGTRWCPTYDSVLEMETIDIDCGKFLSDIRSLGKNSSPLELEKILTRVRLPVILQYLSKGTRSLIYTHYINEINQILHDAISAAGYRVGFYTGESKDGLNDFKAGKLDVLIGSSAISTGVDGLQFCCNQLIVNVLPWTNAEYEQLIGRLWRQGQIKDKVKVIVPTTYTHVNGQRWSYCDSKLQRIRYKKSIADASVDGSVPEGNLRSPAQAQSDVIAWLERLEKGEQSSVTRRKIVVPLLGDVNATRRRLARYGEFSQMNNRWNKLKSQNLGERLRANPEEWEQYHTLYSEARAQWSVIPFEEMISWCQKREGYEIGDFGCGEALLAKAIGDRHNVHNFDHIAIDDSVIEGDMSHTPLDGETLDVAVFSLSLMGNNFTDYLREAYRVLKIDGHLHIWEATSRFSDVQAFCSQLETIGFKVFPPEQQGQFTHIHGNKTDRQLATDIQLQL